MKKVKKLIIYFVFPLIILILALYRLNILLIPVVIIYLSVFVIFEIENIYKIVAASQFKKNKLNKALRTIYKAYKIKGSSIHTGVTFVYFLLKSGKHQKAGEIIAELEKRPMTSQEKNIVMLDKALYLWKTDKINESIALYEELLKEYESTSIYSSYGYVVTLSDNLDKALEVNLKAYEFNKDSKAIQDNLGLTYMKMNQLGKAYEIYEKLMASEPQFPEAYYNMALIMEMKHDVDDALHYLKKALNFEFNGLSTVTKEEVENKISQLKKLYGKPL